MEMVCNRKHTETKEEAIFRRAIPISMPILHKYLYSNQNTIIHWPHQRLAHEQQQPQKKKSMV